VKHCAAALDAAKVPTEEKAELPEIFVKLKPEIGQVSRRLLKGGAA
jgi:hypothetical protein